MSIPPLAAHANLYEQVADRIADLIARGTYRPGQRVPSVRKMSQQAQVSISTVLEAYRRLERRGLIEARPQSGYYVKLQLRPAPAEPDMSRPAPAATPVSISRLVMSVLHAVQDRHIVKHGAAIPSPQFMPIAPLNRLTAQLARRYPEESNAYDFAPGHEPLRLQIARRAVEAGCNLAPSDLITTCGSTEAMQLCLRAVTRPGDTVAVESPTYYGIFELIEALHLKAMEIPTHPRHGICLDSLEEAVARRKVKAALLVPNFNNPLGSCMSDDRKKRLVNMLARHEVPLIEDDLHGELYFGDHRPSVCKAFDRTGNVLLVSSFSKTLAPGWRVGYTAPGRFRDAVARLKLTTTLTTPTLPQMAIAEYLASGAFDRHLRRLRRSYHESVSRFTQGVADHFPEGTRVTRPAGGYVLWVELPRRVNALELHRLALSRRISITPGPVFSAGRKYDHFIRLNCGLPWSTEIESALSTLGRLAAQMLTSKRRIA